MLSLPIIAVFLITLAVAYWLNGNNELKRGKPIPGPRTIPVLGNLHQIGSLMHIKFGEWAVKYGDIFKVRLGNKLAVVISDPKMMKEVFAEPAFSGRQLFEGFGLYSDEQLGIVTTEGEMWNVHRRFLIRELKEFGFSKSNSMEQLIVDEVKETIQHIKSLQIKNKSISDIKQIFSVAVTNSLWLILRSTRYDHDDSKLIKMMIDADRIMTELVKRSIFFLIPWTRYFLPKLKDFDVVQARNRKFYQDAVNDHKATYKEGNIRDFIDVYINEMNAQKNDPKSMFYGDKAERQLHAILGDLHFAGSDTTSASLTWSALYLSEFKHVQEKLQKEIYMVTNDARAVSISDKPSMPFTLALMDEILRYSSIVPVGLQHRAMEGKEFKGYYFPKDTWIFANLHHLHHNPSIWGDPKNFRPERFLSADGLTYKKNENLMPFQIGRRQCIGETLARDTFFLFLTNIFQKFSMSFDPNVPKPSLEPKVSFILVPEAFSIIVKERESQ